MIRLVTLAGIALLWEVLGQTGWVFGEALPPLSAVIVAAARLVGIALLWEVPGQMGWVFGEPLPPAPVVIVALAREITSLSFYEHLAVTFGEVAGGFVFGVLPGVAVGLLLGARRVLGAAADPYVAALATTPKIVFLPIVMLMVGIGPGSKVALGAVSAFFPVVIATAAGMRAIPAVFVRVGRAFKLKPGQMVRMVYLPALALPIVTGMRLGLGVCIIGVLLGEIKLAKAGLGFLANDYYTQYSFPGLYAIVAIVFALAAAANAAMSRLVRRAEARR